MKPAFALVLGLVLLLPSAARADFRQIDLSIFGMD